MNTIVLTEGLQEFKRRKMETIYTPEPYWLGQKLKSLLYSKKNSGRGKSQVPIYKYLVSI